MPLSQRATPVLGIVLALVFLVKPATAQVDIVPSIGHQSGAASSVAVSPDDELVASAGSSDNTLAIWKSDTAKLLKLWSANQEGSATERTLHVRFTADGRWLISIGTSLDDSSVAYAKLWNAADFSFEREVELGKFDTFSDVAVTASGDEIFYLSRLQLVRQKLAAGSAATTLGDPYEYVSAFGSGFHLALSPDERQLALGGTNRAVDIYDLGSNRLVRSTSEHADVVTDVAYSPDGKYLASAGDDLQIQVRDAKSFETVATFEGHRNPNDYKTHQLVTLSFLPDSQHLITGGKDGGLYRWQIASGERTMILDSKASPWNDDIEQVVSFADGRRVLTSGPGDEWVRLWDVETGVKLLVFDGNLEPISAMDVSDNGRRVAVTAWDVLLQEWDLETGTLLVSSPGRTRRTGGLSYSPDGSRLIGIGSPSSSFANHVMLDAETGRIEKTLTFRERIHEQYATGYSPIGDVVAGSGNTPVVTLWDAQSGKVVREFKEHTHPDIEYTSVYSIVFADNGRTMATSDTNAVVVVRDVESGAVRFKKKVAGISVRALDISPDGTVLVSGGRRPNIGFFDMQTGAGVGTYDPDRWWVESVAFSPDGKSIVFGAREGAVVVVDAATGSRTLALAGHNGEVPAVRYTPDGSKIVSASGDGSIKVWRAADGKLLISLIANKEGDWLALTPEGFFNVGGDGDSLLHLVRGRDVISIDQVFDALYRPDLVRQALAGDPDGMVKAAAAALDLDKVISSGLPPMAKIVSPIVAGPGSGAPAVAQAPGDAVEVAVELEDRGGGIGRVEFRVNGTTQGTTSSRGLTRVAGDETPGKASGETVTIRQRLFLSAGSNEISVVAYNQANLIASSPLTITLDLDAEAISDPKLFVLAVGIDDYYDSRLRLNYAVSDATSIGRALQVAGREIYSDIVVRTVLDDAVTRDGLDEAFAGLAGQIRPGDVFVFFLAGHGKTLDGRYYFLPRDFRYEGDESIRTAGIGQAEWQEWFASIPAQKSVALYDTCESGTLTGDQSARSLEGVAALDRLTRATGRTTLTAATDTAPALEGYRGHGLFTYAVLDALANGDGDSDSQIEVTELAAHVDRLLPRISEAAFGYRQVPQMSIRGNSFPLVAPTQILAAGDRPIIARKPTHVVIQPADLFESPNGARVTAGPLAPGTLVTLVRTEDGWSLVARKGDEIGYVAPASLAEMQ